MNAMDWAFDGTLAVAIPVLAWRVLASHDLPKAVVIFVAMGLVSTIGWARLDAPDIALVEAAVGAGITGALLMNALGWISAEQRLHAHRTRLRWPHAVLASVLACGVGLTLIGLPELPGLAAAVHEAADGTVGHPVTAVLLDFRGYDTFLEIAVLLVAAITARLHAPAALVTDHDPLGSLVGAIARLLAPGMVLVAAYLVWRGANAPGGAFQAAAVIGGGGILLVFARILQPPRMSSPLVRGALVGGFIWFVLVAAAPLALGRPLLAYPVGWAKGLILSIELGLTISIALALVMFFPGEPPDERARAQQPQEDRW